MDIKKLIRDVENFPKQGITFKDITPLLSNFEGFQASILQLQNLINEKTFTHFAGIESRGFIFASALAQSMNKGLHLIRKPGKLPGEVFSEVYDLEYGQDELQISKYSFSQNDKIIIVDDVLATGGTAQAAEKLITQSGANVTSFLFLMELSFLEGKSRLKAPIQSLLTY